MYTARNFFFKKGFRRPPTKFETASHQINNCAWWTRWSNRPTHFVIQFFTGQNMTILVYSSRHPLLNLESEKNHKRENAIDSKAEYNSNIISAEQLIRITPFQQSEFKTEPANTTKLTHQQKQEQTLNRSLNRCYRAHASKKLQIGTNNTDFPLDDR